jgi:hypothetical protein
MAILWDRDMVNCPGLRPFKEVREVYDCSTECGYDGMGLKKLRTLHPMTSNGASKFQIDHLKSRDINMHQFVNKA